MSHQGPWRAGVGVAVAMLAAMACPKPAFAADTDAEGFETHFPGNLQLVRQERGRDGMIASEVRDRVIPGLLKQHFDRAWASDVDAACAGIRQRVAARVADAIRPPRLVNCELAPAGELRARVQGRNVEFKYVTTGNVVTFWVTTPDVCILGICAGVPRELDPKFTVTFDAELRVRIPVAGAPGRLEAEEAVSVVRNARMDSNNVTGDLAGVVDALVRGFGGAGFFRDAEEQFNAESSSKREAINAGLAPFGAILQREASALYSDMSPKLENGTVLIAVSRRLLAFDGRQATRSFAFDGTWNTGFGVLTLRQNGPRVEGNYSFLRGRVSGTVTGSVLRGRWREGADRAGDLEFTLVDRDHFRGCWRTGSVGEMNCNWNGVRK